MSSATNRPVGFAHDFEATIRILRTDEGGRKGPIFNGIRWDLGYADEATDQVYMIHPDFVDGSGASLPPDQPLPVNTKLLARMTVLVDEMREEVHRAKIKTGTKFFCKEGSRSVAEGEVTKIVGLFAPRKFP